jgi:hypothetical protein
LFDPCAEVNCARRIINKNFIAGTTDVVVRIDGVAVPNIKSHLVGVDRTPNAFLVDAGPVDEDGYGGIMSALTGQPTGGTLRLAATLDLVVEKTKSCHPHRHCP